MYSTAAVAAAVPKCKYMKMFC